MPFDVQDDFDDAALWAALDSAPAGPHHLPPVRPPPPARPPPTSAPSGPPQPPLSGHPRHPPPPGWNSATPAPGGRPALDLRPVAPDPRGPHPPLAAPAPRAAAPPQPPAALASRAPPASVGISVTNYDRVQAGPAPPAPRRVRVELALEKTGGRVAVVPPPGVYDEALVAACRRIPGAAFDSRQRRWTFPDASLSAAAREFKSARGVVVDLVPPHPIAQRALAAMAQLERAAAIALAERAEAAGDAETGTTKDDRSPGDACPPATFTSPVSALTEDGYARIPEALREAMFPFQREGVRFGLARGGRVLIGDQMGLGKTVQALALMACYRDEWPALILVPTSLRGAWESALRRWLDVPANVIAAVGSGGEAHKIHAAKVAIVPYSLVGKMAEKLTRRAYQVVVCDESHFLKDPKAQRTKAVTPLLKAARRAICLTGTPALSRPVELYSQVEALRPNVFTKFTEFAQRYCSGARFGWQGCVNADELFAVISRLVMVRRLKKDVLTQLPPKQRQQVILTLPKGDALNEVRAIQEQLKTLREMMGGEAFDVGGGGGDGPGGRSMEEKRLMTELYGASARAKTRPVQEYLETLLDGGSEKFLFFAHHKVMLDAATELLLRRKTRHVRIDGATPTGIRQKLVDEFQNDEGTRVAVLSIKAAGMGLTLTAASLVVFGELSWTPGDIVQAEDRAHRIGQVNSVDVKFLCAKNTVDDVMWGSVQNKLENLGQVLDGTSGDCLELAKSAQAPPRTREQRLASLAAFGDRSPGGGPRRDDFAALAGEPPKRQATLDGFVAKRDSGTGTGMGTNGLAGTGTNGPEGKAPSAWRPPPEWEDDDAFTDSQLFNAEAKRPRHD